MSELGGSVLENIVAEHQHYIYNLVYNLCSDTDDADDIVQETFLKAMTGLKDYRGEAEIRTWLSRIAINTFIDTKRKEKPHISMDLGLVPCPSGGPERAIIRKEMQWCVRHVLLHHVSEEHKVVLVLRDMQGYSYQEIADTLSITVPAVKSRLHRGRAAFYGLYSGHIPISPFHRVGWYHPSGPFCFQCVLGGGLAQGARYGAE